MPKEKKKFIDKKYSETFQLVHRSQRDPLIVDENAPKYVLKPVEDSQLSKHQKKLEAEMRKEELEKYGIFYEDDYDYAQHLRSVGKSTVEWTNIESANQNKKTKENSKFDLPHVVFESEKEEEVGLLHRVISVGLRLDLDPEVVAAMDDDFDFDDPNNQLEDDFISLAGGIAEEVKKDGIDADGRQDDEDEWESDDSSDNMEFVEEEKNDDLTSLNGKQFTFRDEETKSRFTEYSMSSSIIKRNAQLSLLDDRFEKMYESYDDTEIGALDSHEIEGALEANLGLLLQHADELKDELGKYEPDTKCISELMKERLKLMNEDSDSGNEQDPDKLLVEPREKDRWDCESILSTYSNIYNHPKLINEPKYPGKIKINPKTGIPKNVLGNPLGRLTARNLAQLGSTNDEKQLREQTQSVAETTKSTISMLSVRFKDETPTERNERKRALKKYRKERRIEKKMNKEAFKDEKKRQEKIMVNNIKNVQGNRLV